VVDGVFVLRVWLAEELERKRAERGGRSIARMYVA
jgi:hypothetical protein